MELNEHEKEAARVALQWLGLVLLIVSAVAMIAGCTVAGAPCPTPDSCPTGWSCTRSGCQDEWRVNRRPQELPDLGQLRPQTRPRPRPPVACAAMGEVRP